MPVMDGWAVLDQLRADGRLARLKVLVTTSAASNTPSDVPVFVKPLDFEKLNEVLKTSTAQGKRPPAFVRPPAGKQTSLGAR